MRWTTTWKKSFAYELYKEARELRKPDDGLIHHSDAGSQYTGEAYKLSWFAVMQFKA